MALVTLEASGTESVFTIKTAFVDLTVNTLFTFLNTLNSSLTNSFRLSLNDGTTWESWLSLTDVNIRAINVDRGIKLVAQVKYDPNASYLLINDTEELCINDDDDLLLTS